MNLKRSYKILLRLYPREYRALFAAEMLAAFEEAHRQSSRSGATIQIRFMIAEVLGLVFGAGTEWTAKLAYSLYHSNSYLDCRGARDLRLMRPAGVSWEAFYGVDDCRAQIIHMAEEPEVCLNALQSFPFSSHLKRLIIFARGASCRCKRVGQPSGNVIQNTASDPRE